MKEFKTSITVAGKEVIVETGKYAFQSQGAVMLTMGGTTLLATATVDKNDSTLDYFPLGVEYIEKMYARGAISGSRFQKRETRPSDEAVIKAREVDHSIRSLFPKSFKRAVSVVLTVLSYDGENDPQALTIIGTSMALLQSGVPFAGPCSSVIACVSDSDEVIINPSAKDREQYKAEFIISAVDNKLLSLEGWGKEVSEETMDAVLDKANEVIVDVNRQQVETINQVGKTLDIDPNAYDNKPAPAEVIANVKELKLDAISEALFNGKADRNDLISEIKKELREAILTEDSQYSELDVDQATEYVARKVLRDGVMKEGKRVSGRGLEEIRELKAEINVLPDQVHGSALFSRGLTQTLSVVTLGPKSNEMIIDDMEGETTKAFMHHYNFPPFSTGEAGRYSYYPGRREIGHGAIGENALMNMIPSEKEFPYTIRAVSETLSSNGSTSMSATCASSLALMAAGVPMKEQVAGIGVGLVTNDENVDDFKLILDIEGIEDFYGDMDFKICGTKNGITAIQYENKLQGVPLDIIKKAFRLAKTGRETVLEAMNAVIDKPAELSKNAPKVDTTKIPADRIGEFIGPGGKNIKALVESTAEFGEKADIAIDDDGIVTITGVNSAQVDFVKNRIIGMFKEPEVGEEYDGVIDKIMNFGFFVDVSPSISGLAHISEVSDEYVKDLNDKFKVGQEVRVKIIKVEDGKISFTLKGVTQPS